MYSTLLLCIQSTNGQRNVPLLTCVIPRPASSASGTISRVTSSIPSNGPGSMAQPTGRARTDRHQTAGVSKQVNDKPDIFTLLKPYQQKQCSNQNLSVSVYMFKYL